MDIRSCATTFDIDEIWTLSISVFADILEENKEQLKPPYNKLALFSFYEHKISYPIDDLKDAVDESRVDFLEAILLMSWAIYRDWVKKVVDGKHPLNCFNELSKDDVVKLFLDNLNCEEGMLLLKKINEPIGWADARSPTFAA